MATLEFTEEQLATLRAGWQTFLNDNTDNDFDDLAEALEISEQDRGKEDEDGNENDDYDSANDPVVTRVDEVTKILGI
jgi:hypothetical protein